MSERSLVRVQEKGQVTLPARLRSKFGIKKGDLVAVEETPAGLLISPQRAIAAAVLERVGKTLAEQDISLADV
jgi:AbrB family looped-hinge helix DNA binding protein